MALMFVYAAPREGDSIAARLAARGTVARLGVGKVAATLTLTRLLAQQRPEAVVAFGVAGARRPVPAGSHKAVAEGPPGAVASLAIRQLVVVSVDVLADEGVQTDDEFLDLARLGLTMPPSVAGGAFGALSQGVYAPTGRIPADSALTRAVAERLAIPVVRGMTVSTCSGTDALADARHARTGADVETMEGAAVGHVCAAFGVPWVQLRAISNFTGDRAYAAWDLDGSTSAVQHAVLALVAAGLGS